MTILAMWKSWGLCLLSEKTLELSYLGPVVRPRRRAPPAIRSSQFQQDRFDYSCFIHEKAIPRAGKHLLCRASLGPA